MEFSELFGKVKEGFSEKTLCDMFTAKNIEGIKKYVCSYFLKLSNARSVLMWIPEEGEFEQLKDEIVKSRYIKSNLMIFVSKNEKWSLSDWFFGLDVPSYRPSLKVNAPTFVAGKHGTKYVNMLPKMPYNETTKKSLKDYPEQVQENVMRIWDHLKIVYCSRKMDQFLYCQKFFASIVAGRKMTTAMYIRSLEGIGKSIWIDFIRSIMGSKLIMQTSDVSILIGKDNGGLVGKVLFVLEEAPCETMGQWKIMDSKLKNYITEPTITIRKLYQDHITVENPISFIVFSNKDAVHIGWNTRRWFQLDVSSEYMGKHEYFSDLRNRMKDTETQEAFFWNCIEIYEQNKDWNEQQERPISSAVKTNISNSAPTIVTFIKERFVLQNKGIDMKSGKLYEMYVEYCKENKINFIVKKAMAIEAWQEIGITYLHQDSRHHNQNWVRCLKEDLLKEFQKRHLLHHTDDFVNEEEQKELEETVEIIQGEKKEPISLEERIIDFAQINKWQKEYREEKEENEKLRIKQWKLIHKIGWDRRKKQVFDIMNNTTSNDLSVASIKENEEVTKIFS